VFGAEQGWSSCLSLPYVLSVVDGRLVAQPHPDVAAHRTDTVDDGGEVFDLEWLPAVGGDRLQLVSATAESAVVELGDGVVRLERPGHKIVRMPWSGGPVRVIVDGPTIEISSLDGVVGGPIDPVSRMLPVAGSCRAWRLA
jgi:beta-fructofuranosidase